VQALRDQDLFKVPGVPKPSTGPRIDAVDARTLTPQVVGDTLGACSSYQDDIARMQGDTLQKDHQGSAAIKAS